jgi:hypothetical protein
LPAATARQENAERQLTLIREGRAHPWLFKAVRVALFMCRTPRRTSHYLAEYRYYIEANAG